MTRADSSSSSDDELERFQGVAVSGEQIAALAHEQAKSAGKRKSIHASRQSTGNAAIEGPAPAAGTRSRQADEDKFQTNELDLIQQRIATALDQILDRQLSPLLASTSAAAADEPTAPAGAPKHGKKKPKAPPETAGAAAADGTASKGKEKCTSSSTAPSGAAAHGTLWGTGADDAVRLFRRVKPGTPCVLAGRQPPDPEPRPHRAPKRRRRKDAPLPASAEELARLAVDGRALLAGAVLGLAEQGWVEAKLPLPGTVVDPKVFVPHDQRIAVLLGRAAPARAPAAR